MPHSLGVALSTAQRDGGREKVCRGFQSFRGFQAVP